MGWFFNGQTCGCCWFQTWLLFSISYMGCHPSHWRTPSFFKMVIAPPTSLDVLSWRWLLDDYIVLSCIIPVVFLISTKKRTNKFPLNPFNVQSTIGARLDDTRRIDSHWISTLMVRMHLFWCLSILSKMQEPRLIHSFHQKQIVPSQPSCGFIF